MEERRFEKSQTAIQLLRSTSWVSRPFEESLDRDARAADHEGRARRTRRSPRGGDLRRRRAAAVPSARRPRAIEPGGASAEPRGAFFCSFLSKFFRR